jgi:hypothetical protein
MNRSVMLAFGAAALIALGVILYLAVNTDNTPASASAEPDRHTEPTASNDPTSTRATPPAEAKIAERTGPVREWVRDDGRRVRDHRTAGSAAPPTPEPPPPRPDGRTIKPAVTADVGNRLEAVIKDCVVGLPRHDKTSGKPRPRLQGNVFVTIKDKQLSVTEADLSISELAGDAAAAAKTCMQQKSVGISTVAEDEADVERYAIRINYQL